MNLSSFWEKQETNWDLPNLLSFPETRNSLSAFFFLLVLTQHDIHFPQLFSFPQPTPFFGCLWLFPNCFSFSFTSFLMLCCVLFCFALLSPPIFFFPVAFFLLLFHFYIGPANLISKGKAMKQALGLHWQVCAGLFGFYWQGFQIYLHFRCVGQCCFICVLLWWEA